MNNKKNGWSLIPAAVFLILYLGLGILFEYVLKIEMGFYSIPIIVIFMVSILVACMQNKSISFDKKLDIMSKGIDTNIITMILVFLCAGVFVGVTGRESAQSVAYFMLSYTPSWLSVAIIFLISCFVSLSMGTSCGTISLLVPIAAAISKASGYELALCIGAVISGSMFGDNLSFISDTTIAACNTQGCKMKDKFKANFKLALPAAIITLIIIIGMSVNKSAGNIHIESYNLIMIIPYILVLIFGLMGVNVFITLLIGIISGTFINMFTGNTNFHTLLTNMGSGVSGMYETIMVTILVSMLCALIRANGGFDVLLSFIRKIFKGNKGGQLGMGLLAGVMDISTANNTVAIVMAGPVAKEMSKDYDITPQRAASILDTFSCIFQGILPYGAQMLLAIAAASQCGYKISAFQIMPYLHYQYILAIISVIYIFFSKKEK